MSGHPVPWRGDSVTLAAIATDARTAGQSTCPLCGLTWTVTPATDCMMPACGCFGFDASEANPHRPCEPCGLRHALERTTR